VTWTKATWWSNDQHLKQDLRCTIEDPRNQASPRHEVRNQAGRQDREETSEEELDSEDRTQPPKGPDASDHVTRATAASVHAPDVEKARGPERWLYCSSSRQQFRVHQTQVGAWSDAPAAASDHVQKGSKATLAQPNASNWLGPDSPQSLINACAPTVNRTKHVRSGRMQRPVTSRKLGLGSNG
jgi:hypothetical protein